MNDSVFETVKKSSQVLRLDFSSVEFAKLAEEQELTEAHTVYPSNSRRSSAILPGERL